MIKHRTEIYKLLPKDAVCAELGVAEGYFSAEILRWGVKELYMVDLWATSNEFPGDVQSDKEWHNKNFTEAMERVKSFTSKSKVNVLRGKTVEMAKMVPDESLDLVYLDACHSYYCVLNDLRAWIGKVKPGGVVAGHDYLAPQYGVYGAVKDFAGGWEVITIPEHKNEDAGFYFIK